MFTLHPQLEKDCVLIGHFPLSCLLLFNDANYPWFILVPQRADMEEVYQLSESDQLQLMRESNGLSQMLAGHYGADKMNVAALGNVVPQLHVHHIVRFRSDPAWPRPVWGAVPARPYEDKALRGCMERLQPKLLQLGCQLV